MVCFARQTLYFARCNLSGTPPPLWKIIWFGLTGRNLLIHEEDDADGDLAPFWVGSSFTCKRMMRGGYVWAFHGVSGQHVLASVFCRFSSIQFNSPKKPPYVGFFFFFLKKGFSILL